MKTFPAMVLMVPAASVPQNIQREHFAALQNAGTHLAHKASAGAWQDTGFYVMLVVLVLAIIGLIVKFIKGPPRPASLKEVTQAQMEIKTQEKELEAALKAIKNADKQQDVEAGVAEDDDDDTPAIDYEAALRMAAQAVAQTIGPKIAKGQAVKNILETRVQTLQNQTKTFVLDELNGTAGAVLNELGAEEAMLLLDPTRAVAGNFPPAPVLIAGLFSPIVLGLTAINHIAQALIHFLPIICLCIASLYIDDGQVCNIPGIHYWLYAHTAVGGVLLLSHLCQVVKVVASRSYLTAEMQKKGDLLKELAAKCKGGDISQIREMFVQTCVMIQKALQQEDNVRRSIFAKLIGFFTFIWIGLTVWTFVIVLGWTLVPGTIAFHHSAAEVAGDEYCGAWFTVFTARLCCIIGVLFLLVNLGTVSQWCADSAKFSPAFAESVLGEAKKIDEQAGGIPVVQILVKAFVLRGSSETLELQMSTAAMDRNKFQAELYAAQKELSTLESQLGSVNSEHESLTKQVEQMPGRTFVAIKPKARDLAIEEAAGPSAGQRATEVAGAALSDASLQAQKAFEEADRQMAVLQKQADGLKEQGKELSNELAKQLENLDVEAQKKQALALAQRTREELQHMIEEIMKKMQEIKESESFQSAMAEVQARAAQAKKLAEEKLNLLRDSELGRAIESGDTEALKKMGYANVEIAQKKAKEMAAEAMKAAQELQDSLEGSDLGAALKGDTEALKRLGVANIEAAQKKFDEMMEQAKAAAAQAKQLVDGSELGRAITSGDTEALKKLGYANLEEAQKQAQVLVEEGKKVAEQAREQMESSELGKAIASGDSEALKKLGYDNVELAQKQAQEMVVQAQQAAAQARALVDDSELGRAIAAGDADALKKMGFDNLEAAQKKTQELLDEGKQAADRARAAMESSELGAAMKAAANGDEAALKQLQEMGYANLEKAQEQAKTLVEQGQQAALQARQTLDDTELGKAIRDGNVAELKKLGIQSVEAAKKKAEEAVQKGQEAAAKSRKEFEDAIASNDVEALKKLGFDTAAEAKKQMDAKIEEAAAAAAKAVAEAKK